MMWIFITGCKLFRTVILLAELFDLTMIEY